MKKNMIAVLLFLVTLALLSADASAMYNPATGTFMQRDPGPGGMMDTTRVGTTGPAEGDKFLPRDPTMQYQDGMSLYEAYFVPNRTDPNGLSVKCGSITMHCKSGDKTWAVYGCSKRAEFILGFEHAKHGCVTLLVPRGIFCTDCCKDLNGLVCGDDDSVPILAHESCHACAFEDGGLLAYLASWAGDLDKPKAFCTANKIDYTSSW